MTNRYTYRTESAVDNNQALFLAKSMGLTVVGKRYVKRGITEVIYITVESKDTFEFLRKRFRERVYNDGRFSRLHTCFQSLAPGNEPSDA